ncbi:DNA topoisomerase I [Candidatus Woesearchaeota archaeon]|nr:DNA topoisomerase I [Candidatus Woesearchaeota archaeon]
MVELIITEKPQASKKIADALADGKSIKKNEGGVPYYLVTHNGKDIIVGCAVGHLFSVAQATKGKWEYPVFNVQWVQSSKTNKSSAFTSKYVNALKKLAKEADEFTIACDYDVEGEVIGYNVLRYICKKKDGRRMKFSTLTKPDLVKSYASVQKTIDWGQALAGETRHFLDWYNGINYSRALTLAMKRAGMFKIMSTGRVQGPALKIIVDREREIQAFKPVPFWQIQLLGFLKSKDIEAWHTTDKFWDAQQAKAVMQKVQDEKEGKVTDVKKSQFKQSPPIPFDLTTLQTESYRCFGISPKETLAIAQELYVNGFISYPRTSSQKLPKEIGYVKIIQELARQDAYQALTAKLLAKAELLPNEGQKTDPAHPSIYPTGLVPELGGKQQKIYDLIVKRFLSVFGEPATRETSEITIDVKGEPFACKGTRTLERGWHVFYEPYVSAKEEELPQVKEKDIVQIKEINNLSKETQPPKRYTPASIIKELERRNLGTKATRSDIVDTLFQRGYVEGTSIQATELGIKTIETLEKYCPKIVDEVLTQHFEEEMELIRENKKKPDEVLSEAREVLTKILEDFKGKEKEIGEKLIEANKETMTQANTVGKCPTCSEGTLMIKRGKFGRFVACDKYPDCKITFKLPTNGLVKPTDKLCETCHHPLIVVIRAGKRPQEHCLNPECKSKYAEGEAGEQAKAIAKGELEKPCPDCKEGQLVLRSSVYGKFYGCSRYPKCKYTESLDGTKKTFTKKEKRE